ncbi:hypothetical protein ABW19_dt0203558 [Dactylella cylindrospora]|nr:hypothetical protein ABW19_dt0203558 [Dactylella cylindrospora]
MQGKILLLYTLTAYLPFSLSYQVRLRERPGANAGSPLDETYTVTQGDSTCHRIPSTGDPRNRVDLVDVNANTGQDDLPVGIAFYRDSTRCEDSEASYIIKLATQFGDVPQRYSLRQAAEEVDADPPYAAVGYWKEVRSGSEEAKLMYYTGTVAGCVLLVDGGGEWIVVDDAIVFPTAFGAGSEAQLERIRNEEVATLELEDVAGIFNPDSSQAGGYVDSEEETEETLDDPGTSGEGEDPLAAAIRSYLQSSEDEEEDPFSDQFDQFDEMENTLQLLRKSAKDENQDAFEIQVTDPDEGEDPDEEDIGYNKQLFENLNRKAQEHMREIEERKRREAAQQERTLDRIRQDRQALELGNPVSALSALEKAEDRRLAERMRAATQARKKNGQR